MYGQYSIQSDYINQFKLLMDHNFFLNQAIKILMEKLLQETCGC